MAPLMRVVFMNFKSWGWRIIRLSTRPVTSRVPETRNRIALSCADNVADLVNDNIYIWVQ